MQLFARQDRDCLWLRSMAFGYPLVAAVYAGHLHIVKVLARQVVANAMERKRYLSRPRSAFEDAIHMSLERQQKDIFKYLWKKYVKVFGVVSRACIQEWLDTAVRNKDPTIVTSLLRTRHHGGVNCSYRAFQICCSMDDANMARLFFDTGVLKVNEMVSNAYPLDSAIKHEASAVVNELLDIGAFPDGPKYNCEMVRPLRTAFNLMNQAIYIILLERGAKPLSGSMKLSLSHRKFLESSAELRSTIAVL